MHKIDTSNNFKGLHAVSFGDEFCVAVPAPEEGHVLLTWFRHNTTTSLGSSSGIDNSQDSPLCVIGKTKVKVNESGVATLALNPTGTVFTKAELEAICDLVIAENESRTEGQKKLYVMFDQIYWTLTFGETIHHNPVTLRPKMKAYTVFVDGISKAFAATGVRVGWSMGPQDLIAKMKSINSHVGSWAPMAEQKAVARFLMNEPALKKYFDHFKFEVNYRLAHLFEGFRNLHAEGYRVDAIKPEAAIYLTVQLDLVGKKTADGKLISNQQEVTQYILDKAKLALVPFGFFGADKESSWYRLSIGCCKKEEIEGVFSNLKKALQELS